ncbi:tape measure protein [Oceanobacillus neutriphilus]|uniref:Membrane protein n=1 Tax=Oceanobacillus neutriphilus TaxID=531815 RepID=A0ABQ2NNQ5_9BACI|nr:tape measure protein [Oceanobacillus neutriphilus]GGP07897.1 membrane protein [Oceanobacillus neutriphilus]
MADGEGKVVINIILNDGQAVHGLDNINNKMGELDKSGEKANLSIGKIAKSVSDIAKKTGVFDMLKDSVNTAFDEIATMEQFERTITAITGSAEKANTALDSTKKIVSGTTYGIDTATNAVQGFVMSNMDVGKATESIAAWGDAVSHYGDGSNEAFTAVTESLAQMVDGGKVQMETMNQLTEAGIPAMRIYADATGQSVEEVANQMQQGEISADSFMDVMNSALKDGTESFGAIDGAAKDAGSSWTNSIDNMKSATVRGITAIIGSIDSMLESAGLPKMQELITAFGPLAVTVFQQVAASSLTLEGTLNTLKKGMEGLGNAVKSVWGVIASHPIIAIISAVVALAAVIIYLWKTNENFRNFFINAWESIKNAVMNFGPGLKMLGSQIVDVSKKMYDASLDAFSTSVQWLGSVAETTGETFSNLAGRTQELIAGMAAGSIDGFNAAMEWLGNTARTVGEFFTELRERINIGAVLAAVIGPLTTIATAFFGLASPIGWVIKGFALLAAQTSLFSDILAVFKGDMSIGEMVNNFAADLSNLITNLAENAVIFIEKGTEMIVGFIDALATNLPELINTGVEVITNLITGLVSALPLLIETWLQLFTTLLEVVVTIIPLILEIGITIITTLIEAIVVALPLLIETWLQLFTTLLEVVVTVIPLILEMGITIITTLIEAIVTALPMLIETYLTIIMTLIDTITTVLPLVIEVFLLLLMTIVTTLIENLPLIIEAGIQILTALIDGIIILIPALIEAAITIIMALVEAVITNLPVILDAGMQILTALINGIIQVLPQLIEAGLNIILALVQAIIGLLPELLNAGIQILFALIDGIISIVPQLIDAGIQLLLELVSAFIGLLPELINAGIQILMALIQGIISIVPQLLSAGMQLILQLAGAIIQLLPQLLNAGVQLITALIGGITQMISNVVSAGWGLVTDLAGGIIDKGKDIYNAAKNIIGEGINGVKEKATDFFNAGKNIVGSIADGIKENVEKVKSAIGNVVQKIRDFLPFSPAKEGPLKDIMYPGITNSLAKNIKRGSGKPLKEMRSLTEDLADEMNPEITNRLRGTSMSLGRVSTQLNTTSGALGNENNNTRTYSPNINNYFTPAESTPSESARKQRQQQQRLAMEMGF